MIPATKAETLASLVGRLRRARIPRFLFFTVEDWGDGPTHRRRWLARISSRLRGPLAVRSSARDEDLARGSMAGHYRSRLDVPDQGPPLEEAIDEVARSLRSRRGDQILVQEMVNGALAAGVVLTRDLATGGPYYSVNFNEAGRADLVTAGGASQKTVLVHREATSGPGWLLDLVQMARELEAIFDARPLDIEFALKEGVFYLLQVRPLVTRAAWAGVCESSVSRALAEAQEAFRELNRPDPAVAGERTALGMMPDWNPAELIGSQPSPLALSLFNGLIADSVWWKARASMGYRRVERPLLRPLAGRPYVDVRNSFNSWLPAGLPAGIETALVEAWLDRLRTRPELHDKVEFEIVQTAFDLRFDETFQARYGDVLDPGQLRFYRRQLRALTCRNVSLERGASLDRALAAANRLLKPPETGSRGPADVLAHSLRLLERCREWGALPFAIVARHAFIAEALLRSAVEEGLWEEEEIAGFRRGIASVAARIRRDFRRARRGEIAPDVFRSRYGHLRPGLFDICSPRYDRRADLFAGVIAETPVEPWEAEGNPAPPRRGLGLDRALAAAGLTIGASGLLAYAAVAMRQREEVKFQLSRWLSDALEGLAAWGENRGLSREDVSYLTLDDWRDGPRELPWRDLVAGRREAARRRRGLRLGPLIRHVGDFRVIEMSGCRANFVTRKNVVGSPLWLENRSPLSLPLRGRIACLDSADPGFDWLFSRGVAGLVTKFGGSNSHMAIRCAELSVPAAIGVGEGLFDRLLDSPSIELRCREGVVRPLGV